MKTRPDLTFADVNDFHASVARAVLGSRFRTVSWFRRADTGCAQPAAVVDVLLQDGDDADGALTRQVEIVLKPERLDRLIVGVADDPHPARDFVERGGD